MKKTAPWVELCLIFLVASCVPTTITPTEVSASIVETLNPQPIATIETTVQTGLKYEDALNAFVDLPFFQQGITLNNGEAAGTGVNVSFTAKLLPDYALGDLNDDGQDDLAVLIAENGGGSGVFVSMLVFLSQEGPTMQAGAVMIDDRPVIRSLSIANGEIYLEALVHNLNDEMTDPKLSVKRTYRLLEGGLVLMEQTSAYDNGTQRFIQIDSPIEGEIISNNYQVTGSMSVAPFENNLAVTIFDFENNILYQSGFMVSADEPGGPATFDNPIDLSNIPSGTTLRLELAEQSMADGSILVSNSVLVTVK